MLKKLVAIKLNGGLGTAMNIQGPKSTMKIKGDFTFLDLTVQQTKVIAMAYAIPSIAKVIFIGYVFLKST